MATATSVVLSANPSPSMLLAEVDFTAVVRPTSGTAVPTGTVAILLTSVNPNVTLGTATLDTTGRVVVQVFQGLVFGPNTIKAMYTPADGTFSGSSTTITQYVFEGMVTGTVVLSDQRTTLIVGPRVGRKRLQLFSKAAVIATDLLTLITNPTVMHQILNSEYLPLDGYEGPIWGSFPNAAISELVGLQGPPQYWVLPHSNVIGPTGTYTGGTGALTFVEQFQ